MDYSSTHVQYTVGYVREGSLDETDLKLISTWWEFTPREQINSLRKRILQNEKEKITENELWGT